MPLISRLFSSIVGPAAVMAAGTMGAGAAATLILLTALALSLWLMVEKLPDYVTMLAG